MAMALGVSATAFAANPFSDLPAGHWAYASVAKLAAAGIVDGYPDGTFKGERTMTRYEMAQIVAKALAKGAIGADDKLVGEFADELDNLGVRVAKLEKNADNVRVSGNVRLHYSSLRGDTKDFSSGLRSRVFITGEVNDNWHYTGMLQNSQDLIDNDGNSRTDFQRAFLEGNIGKVNLTLGRYNDTIGSNGYVWDDRVDGIRASVGKDVRVSAAYGKMANADYAGSGSNAGKYWHAQVAGDMGKVGLEANYVSAKNVAAQNAADDKIWTLGAKYNADNWTLGATYLKGSSDFADAHDYGNNGYVVGLTVGGASKTKPGSIGFWANYYNQSASTFIAPTFNASYNDGVGFKGYGVGLDYALAKNMTAAVQWFDLKDKDGNNDGRVKTLWTEMMVYF